MYAILSSKMNNVNKRFESWLFVCCFLFSRYLLPFCVYGCHSYVNPLPAEWALRALIDFTLSNARRFYSSMGNLLDGKGLSNSEVNAVRVTRESACSYSTGPTNLLRLRSLLAFFAPLVTRDDFLIFTLLTHLYARRVSLFLRANLSEKCQ